MDRNFALLHGTSVTRAIAICATQTFARHDTYLVSTDNRDVAIFFAGRAGARDDSGPALVEVVVEESALDLLRNHQFMKLTSFDEQDDPRLRGRNQWIIQAGAMDYLNRGILEVSWEHV